MDDAKRLGLPNWDGALELEPGEQPWVPQDAAEVLGPAPDPRDAAAWHVWAEQGRRFLLEEGNTAAQAMTWWGRVIALRLDLAGVECADRTDSKGWIKTQEWQRVMSRLAKRELQNGKDSRWRSAESGGVAVRQGRLISVPHSAVGAG